jgi:hypothetical protein
MSVTGEWRKIRERERDSMVISHVPADSDPSWTGELACHASKVTNSYAFFLSYGKNAASTKKMLSGEASHVMDWGAGVPCEQSDKFICIFSLLW